MQLAADASMFDILININGGFYCPVVCWSGMKRTGVGVTKQPFVFLGYEIRVFLQSIFNSGSKFFCRRNVIFKGNCGMLYIRSINI